MPPISPTKVPTSFVPKQPVKPSGRFSQSGTNALLFISTIVFAVAVVGAIGVFGFEKYLQTILEKKAQEVTAVQASLNTEQVQEFVRTRNRFSAAQDVLENHVTASKFFALLEKMTLKTVQFSSLTLVVADDRSATLDMSGVARTFNALAAQSSLLAGEKQVKRAIFSNISVNNNSTVDFTLEAEVDAKLITLTSTELEPMLDTLPEQAPQATSTVSQVVESNATTTASTTTPSQPSL